MYLNQQSLTGHYSDTRSTSLPPSVLLLRQQVQPKASLKERFVIQVLRIELPLQSNKQQSHGNHGMQIIYNHIISKENKKPGYRRLPTLAWDSDLVPVKEGRSLYMKSSQTSRKAKVTAQNKFDTCVGTVHIIDDVLVPHNILCSLPFDQCGGEGWTGPTCCVNHGSTEFHCDTSPGSSGHVTDRSYKQCMYVLSFLSFFLPFCLECLPVWSCVLCHIIYRICVLASVLFLL